MGFRHINTRKRWLDYCQQQQEAVDSTGLPSELFRRPDILEEFLQDGRFYAKDGTETMLSDLPDAAFLALETIVNGYFDFQQSYPSFCEERLKRFKRYG